MQLYHATPKANLDCIKAIGLDPNRSQGKLQVVWLHTQSRRDWAILHTSIRHKCDVSEVAIIEVNVPRSKLRRRRRGLWTTPEPITEFGRIADASEFAESPNTRKERPMTQEKLTELGFENLPKDTEDETWDAMCNQVDNGTVDLDGLWQAVMDEFPGEVCKENYQQFEDRWLEAQLKALHSEDA